MKWFKRLFGSKVSPVVVVKTKWRNNMWVMTEEGVGVLFDFAFPESLVHLVNDKGETVKDLKISTSMLRQATWDEIPAVRRGIDREAARALGY